MALDIIWPINLNFKLKNQRNWLNQVWMWKFWNVMNCIILHWYKHLTLVKSLYMQTSKNLFRLSGFVILQKDNFQDWIKVRSYPGSYILWERPQVKKAMRKLHIVLFLDESLPNTAFSRRCNSHNNIWNCLLQILILLIINRSVHVLI